MKFIINSQINQNTLHQLSSLVILYKRILLVVKECLENLRQKSRIGRCGFAENFKEIKKTGKLGMVGNIDFLLGNVKDLEKKIIMSRGGLKGQYQSEELKVLIYKLLIMNKLLLMLK